MLHGRLTLRRLAHITSLTTLAALSLGVSAAHAAFPGQDGRITSLGHFGQITAVERDGSGERGIAGSGYAWGDMLMRGQAVAPDGQRLIFAAKETCDRWCDSWQETVLGVASLDGGAPAAIWTDTKTTPVREMQNPSWSPDAKAVIVAAYDRQNKPGLWVIPVNGSDPRQIPLPTTIGAPDYPAFSPDGTRIAFSAGEDNKDARIYVVPAAGGTPISLGSGYGPSWSPDGTHLAYVTVDGDGHGRLAARPVDGGAPDILFNQGNADVSGRPAWSPSGDYVGFSVTRLDSTEFECSGELRWVELANQTHGGRSQCQAASAAKSVDWGPRPQLGETRLVSRSAAKDNEGGNGDVDALALTAKGRYAFYTTRATDTADGDANGQPDVYRRDIASGEVALVSGAGGATANGASDTPVGTPDGHFVAFRSFARNLIAGFEGGDSAVYVRDMETGEISLVSRHLGKPKLGTEGDAWPVAISADGRYILIATDATDVLEGQPSEKRRALYRFDRTTGATLAVDAGADQPAGAARMSAEGRYVAFESNAQTLVAGFKDHNGDKSSIFRRDLDTGTTVLVDGANGGATESMTGTSGSSLRGMSADGEAVLFSSGDQDPLPGFDDNNGDGADLFLRRLDQPAPYLASANKFELTSGSNGTGVGEAAMSADGRVVVFTSDSNILSDKFSDRNGDGAADVWVRRFTPEPDEEATLVTVGARGDGNSGDKASSVAGLSADGRYALVRSRANDLTAALQPHDRDVLFRIDLRDRVVTVVTALDNTAPEADVSAPAISDDGRTVAYLTDADNVLRDFLDHNETGADAFAWLDHSIVDADVTSPDIEIVTPVQGGIYRKGRNYEAEYSCRDLGGSGLDTCEGTAFPGEPLDTDTAGMKTFTVTASDRAGNTMTRSVTYRVAPVNEHLSLASGSGTSGAAADSTNTTLGGDFVGYESAGKIYRRDLRTGETLTVADGAEPRISADGRFVAFVAGGKLSVRDVQEQATRVVHTGETAEHQISRDGSTVVYTAGGFVYVNDAKLAAGSQPQVSQDGTRVLYLANDHVYLRDGDSTKLVDHTWRKDVPADGAATGAILSADGKAVLFGSRAANVAQAYHGEGEQLYVSELAGDAKLVSSAYNDPAEGTGASIAKARLSGNGTTVTWQSAAENVIAGFADSNGEDGEDLYARTGAQPARLVAHGETATDGIETHPTVHAISDDGRFVLYGLWDLDADSEPDDPRGDLRRTDLLRDRVSDVASSPLTGLIHVAMNASGRRIAFDTTSENMIDGFEDGNGEDGSDVFAWFDKPPVADAYAKITGPLKLAFDGSDSSDSDGELVSYRWDFGDAKGSDEIKPTHVYGEEDSYTVKLTVEDDGSNAVSFEFEVVAIKGVLTAGAQPLDFLGVDKHLRCAAVRGKELFAGGGGECGTFVALGGKVYGPPELVDGVTPYTPVSQDVSQDGDVAKIVTVVALGTTGAKVRQTDQYVAGTAWYRTDVALENGGDATVYRAGHCPEGHPLHDAGAAMAGCDVAGTHVALLPLTTGAHHEAGAAVLGHLGSGAQPDDTLTDTADPAAMIAWRVKGDRSVGSLASFGPDGTVPLTVALKPDKDTVQPLDENGFTVTVRNANGVGRTAGPIVADSTGVWDYNAGSTTGLTTADPASVNGKHTWDGPFEIAAHNRGELHFGVTHRNGTRIAITTATAAPAAGVTSTGIADLGEAKAAVDAHPIEGSIPNTAIYEGPTGPTNNPEPVFQLVASKETGIHYECRYVPAGWEPCDADYRPGPLADRTYELEVRAVDVFGADETPAKRTFTVDTVAPNTVISAGPKKVTSDNHPVFELRASEPGSRLQCRLDDGAWFACASPYKSDALADGDHRFEARAIDAAGNPDPTPAVWTFRVDTTPPVTVIDGITGRTVRPSGAASAASAGSTVAVGNDGSAALAISCPAGGPACDGTVGLAMESPKAGIAKVVPRDAVTLARTDFTAQPGETVTVKLALPDSARNLVERVGRVAVFPTLDLGSGDPVRGDDLVLTPDPRTARFLDAGRELKVVHRTVTLRLLCAKKCSGSVKLAGHTKTFSGRRMKVRMRVTKRGTQSVRITTKPALTKRLSVTLRAKEARR